jgi:heme oxygenase (biliverdin-IX-beta and delta-forming)
VPPSRTATHAPVRLADSQTGRTRSVRERLRQDTSRPHRDLERRLDLTGPTLSVARYRWVLQAFYGFYEPLESRLRAAATLAALAGPPFELRARAEWLARDLAALGMTSADIARLPRCSQLPEIGRGAQLGGCLYVLEGASLGGQVIARAIDRLETPLGCARFFIGDGAQTAPRWRSVLAWLEQLGGRDASSADEMVEAARATFEGLTRWLQLRGAMR